MIAQDTTTCPRCGAENRCGFGGSKPCWCATEVARRLSPAPGAAACYCRGCLEELLAERTAGDTAI